MSRSEDFRPMSGTAIFNVGGGSLSVEADERVDVDLLRASLDCVAYLNTVLETVRGARRDDRETYLSDIVTLYHATRVHGVSAAGIYLVALGLARESIHMERSQYEFFFKMYYYDHNGEKAVAFVDSIRRSAREFAEKAGYKWDKLSEDELEEFNSLPSMPADFRSMRENLIHDSKFTRNFEDPLVGHLLQNALAGLRDHWLWGSSVTHASNLDLEHVVVPIDEDTLLLNIDSRHKFPNRALADFGQKCYITAIFVSRKFGIEVGDDTVALGLRLKSAADRHLDEPTSVRGMFDYRDAKMTQALRIVV